jgi:hypothetical protein
MSFKYYLYVSDTKIDMLLSQIDPGASHKRGTEVSVDLKMFKAKRAWEPTAGDRYARLGLIVRHLLDHGDVGSTEQPGQFFWGLLPMQWGPFPAETDSSLVFFGGRTEETTVALGGSVKHLLGSVPDMSERGIGRSDMPTMLGALRASSDLEDEYVTDSVDADLDHSDSVALAKVRKAVTRLRGPAQNVEFMAKRLLHGNDPSSGGAVLLGSPIYVALVD